MKLKLDENLSHAAAEVFRQAGHEVETVASEKLSGASDEDVLKACQHEQRALVTLDLDFSNPLRFEPASHAGIAVLRLPSKPSHEDLLAVCRSLVRALEREALGGKLWSVERGRIREYQPPESQAGENA
ncbi:MAG: DUF5615 family PIN-like protein [Planctomycetes bacterium]|nr:DUF5615 family PIN-like protein [Planctomycetota bacterium]